MFSVTRSNLSHVTKRACEDNHLFKPEPGNLRIAIVGGSFYSLNVSKLQSFVPRLFFQSQYVS